MKRRILFDLTDLVAWSGNLTGIQRVVYNLAVRIENEFQNVVFVRFNSEQKKFLKCSLRELSINIQKPDEPNRYDESNSLKNTIRNSKIYALGKKHLPLTLKKIIARSARLLVYVIVVLKDLPKRIFTGEKEDLRVDDNIVEINDNDMIIITGAGWVREGFMDFLCIHKQLKKIHIEFFIHDLVPVLFPQFFNPGFGKYFAVYTFKMVEIGDSFSVQSQSTRKDLLWFMKEMNFNERKVEVIRLGDNINHVNDKIFSCVLPQKPFLISVGTFESRKNYDLIYQAYKLAEGKRINLPPIVIVGRQGWLTNDLKYKIEVDPAVENKIILRQDVSDEELDCLYRNCLFSVYPSFYEGWGLPVAESLSYGKMCLSSETSSMPEIGSDLIEYFDPHDPISLLELLVKYSNEKELLKKVELKIVANYKPTMWDDTAKQYFKILRKTLHGKKETFIKKEKIVAN
jgi:hypothetical protein